MNVKCTIEIDGESFTASVNGDGDDEAVIGRAIADEQLTRSIDMGMTKEDAELCIKEDGGHCKCSGDPRTLLFDAGNDLWIVAIGHINRASHVAIGDATLVCAGLCSYDRIHKSTVGQIIDKYRDRPAPRDFEAKVRKVLGITD